MRRVQPTRLAPGTRLGTWVLEGFLAEGSTGDVYVARAAEGVGRVALKVVDLGDADARDRRRLAREAGLGLDLASPFLLRRIGHAELPDLGLLLIACELLEGQTLQETLRERATLGPGDRDVRRFLVARTVEVASGLAALHERGFVHRDVKPANVILATDRGAPRAVVIDFGLLRPVESETATSGSMTLPYAAPEVLRGGRIDARTDVFSLGVTLHDLLAARTPEQRRASQLFGIEPLEELVPSIERPLAAIVARATALDPARRYRDAAALRDDLRRWQRGRNPRASCARGAPASASRLARLTAGGVLLGGAVLATLAWSSRVHDDLQRSVVAASEPVARVRELVAAHRCATPKDAAAIEAEIADRLARFELLDPHERSEWLRRLACRACESTGTPPFVESTVGDHLARLLPALDGGDLLYAISALGGCGALATRSAMLAAWERTGPAAHDGLEIALLSLAALDGVLSRARAGTESQREDLADAASNCLEQVTPLAWRAIPRQVPSEASLGDRFARLCATVAAIARSERRSFTAPRFPWTEAQAARIAAAAGDESRTLDVLRSEGEMAASGRATLGQVAEFGWYAGVLDEPETACVESIRSLARSRGVAACLAPAAVERWFARGYALGASVRRGELAPPPAGLACSVAVFSPVHVARTQTVQPRISDRRREFGETFHWRFTEPAIVATMPDSHLTLVEAVLEEDESGALSATSHLLLASPGASGVELRFRSDETMPRGAQVVIAAQKDACAALPWTGVATLEVELDGLEARRIDLSDNGVVSGDRGVLRVAPDALEHRLRIRVSADSTVGVRIESIDLAPVRG